MNPRDELFNNLDLWADHTYSTPGLPSRRRRCPLTTQPATVIAEPRPGWQETTENRIRYALGKLVCGQREWVVGVIVERTHSFNAYNRTFFVNGDPVRYAFEDAVAKIAALAAAGEREGER